MKNIMKKVFGLSLALAGVLTVVSCGGNNNPTTTQTPTTTPTQTTTPTTQKTADNDPPSTEDVGFTIHFNKTGMTDDKYKYNIWMWEKGKDGGDYDFTGEDDYGLYAKYKFSDFSSTLRNNSLGFIVKDNKPWSENPTKDVDGDRFIVFDNFQKNEAGYFQIYLKSGDKAMYSTSTGVVADEITYFSLAHSNRNGYQIWFQTNNDFSSFEIKDGDTVLYSNTVGTDKLDASSTAKRKIFNMGNELPDIMSSYTLNVTFTNTGRTMSKLADTSILYDTEDFKSQYSYDGELGAIYTAASTTFKVWSPISTAITLRVYDSGTPANLTNGSDAHTDYTMTKGEKGVFSATVSGNLEGKYYTYIVTNATYQNQEIVDPYAKSTGINGLRGMIVDFSKTNPAGWDTVSVKHTNSQNLTVYETHIADLTSSTTWGGTAENAKKYVGFYEAGTTYTKDGKTVKTGFDHVKELGVNAVQIIPFFDQANDEREGHVEFNWGYNPLNYNSLEGCYSKNPYDGYEKIKEFKNLVKAYNDAGIDIIMDVVYNHVAGLEKSNFDVLMPKYYFRYSSGTPSNGSGCGNETASERAMYRKFMIDSTEFWASEYKLGGFRYDLMGIHDVETMNQLVKNLHDNVDEHITVYGEPWAGGTIAYSGSVATQASLNKFVDFGCFNDKLRDALIKGGLSGISEKGWITNSSTVGTGDVTAIINGIKGIIQNGNDPYKAVNYVTCHDNYTLYDRIKAAGITDEATIKKMAMLANSVVFTTDGVTFMLAGEEFLRTKGGNSNSYNSSYKVNELDYSLKIKNADMFENYKKLIALKTTTSALAMGKTDAQAISVTTNATKSMISYKISDAEKEYVIIHSNGVGGPKNIDLEGYTLYLDTLNLDGFTLSANTTINPYQTIIAYRVK